MKKFVNCIYYPIGDGLLKTVKSSVYAQWISEVHEDCAVFGLLKVEKGEINKGTVGKMSFLFKENSSYPYEGFLEYYYE